MAGNLESLALDLATAMLNPFPSDGLTSNLHLKTSIHWQKKRLISNSSHLLLLNWECEGLGFLLNLIALESPTMSVSTDPILSITGNLAEFQGRLPTFGMPFLFRCTSLIMAYPVALMVAPLHIQFFNQNDSDDSIVFFEN